MAPRLLLASASETRATMLRHAGLEVEAIPARIDEDAIRAALAAEGAGPRDMADALAGLKAQKIADRRPEALVLGADQVLDLDGRALSRADTPEAAAEQLRALSGRSHRLWSAAVVCEGGRPVWRHVAEARLTLHPLSEPFIAAYLARNWETVRDSVGCYRIEAEGVRLMSRVEGDHFTILGLPLIPLLTWLRQRGEIST